MSKKAPRIVKYIRVGVTQAQDDVVAREAKARGVSKAQLLLDCAAEAIDDLDPKRREVGQRDFTISDTAAALDEIRRKQGKSDRWKDMLDNLDGA